MKPADETAEECVPSASKDDTVEPLKWYSKNSKPTVILFAIENYWYT